MGWLYSSHCMRRKEDGYDEKKKNCMVQRCVDGRIREREEEADAAVKKTNTKK